MISEATAFQIVDATNTGPLSSKLRQVNKLIDDYSDKGVVQRTFSNCDINFQEFLEEVHISPRESALIYISNFFHPAWKTVHISCLALKEKPTPYDKKLVLKVFEILKTFGISNKLLNNGDFDLTEKKFLKLFS